MEEDTLNYLLIVMFCGTPCISNIFSHSSASVNSPGGFNEIHNMTICNQTSGYD